MAAPALPFSVSKRRPTGKPPFSASEAEADWQAAIQRQQAEADRQAAIQRQQAEADRQAAIQRQQAEADRQAAIQTPAARRRDRQRLAALQRQRTPVDESRNKMLARRRSGHKGRGRPACQGCVRGSAGESRTRGDRLAQRQDLPWRTRFTKTLWSGIPTRAAGRRGHAKQGCGPTALRPGCWSRSRAPIGTRENLGPE